MTRVALTILVPLILPGVLYVVWLRATGRLIAVRGGIVPLPWPWLIGSGLVLAALTLVAVNLRFGDSPQGAYVPPHVEGDRVVPGRVVPQAKP
jgi:hypothetical protein